MNVTFTSPDPDMDKKFCAEAAEAGFVNLKGHRLVGGMREMCIRDRPIPIFSGSFSGASVRTSCERSSIIITSKYCSLVLFSVRPFVILL